MIKSLASAINIGSGGSVGREGPIVQIGSTIGSTLGQAFHMSDDRVRTLVACGAAGGISATFNAPIAGVFFALEIILGEFTTRAFGVVVISSVTADYIGRSFFGNVPSFPVPPYELVSPYEFGLYAGLGVLAALAGVAFTRTLYWFEDLFDGIHMPEYLKPIPGGLLLGTMGLFLPQIFGVGYPAMGQALDGNYGLGLLLILVVAKILAVSLTIGSGGSGGVFAPSLFIGAMLGTAFGTGVHAAMPGLTAPAGAYGLVGMGAVFAGAARAPITSVIILFELTGDYRIILPLMLAVVIATQISDALSRDTIYTLKLRRRGIDLRAGKEVNTMVSIEVAQAMRTQIAQAHPSTTAAEAGEMLEESKERALLVVDEEGNLDGIVTIRDVERALLDNKPGATLAEVASRPVQTAFSDELLSEATRRMGVQDLAQLPVVARSNPRVPIGILRRVDVIRAYSKSMIGRIETQRQRPVMPQELRGTRFVEVKVESGTVLDGRRLSELELPRDTLIVAIERGQQTVIPSGSTRLEGGDRVLIHVRDDAVAELLERLAATPSNAGSDKGGGQAA